MVFDIEIIDPSCGFTNNPTVRIVGGGGTGATATSVETDGLLTSIIVTDPGSGYTNAPRVLIESPPFTPTVAVAVSAVKVTQHVRINHNYLLEGSPDLSVWTPTAPPFTAEQEYVAQELPVSGAGQFFRIREVP